jgi:hypothetical protein
MPSGVLLQQVSAVQLQQLFLADLLGEHGMKIDHQALINKINKGNFSFAFAMEVLTILGETRIDIPPLPPRLKSKNTRS